MTSTNILFPRLDLHNHRLSVRATHYLCHSAFMYRLSYIELSSHYRWVSYKNACIEMAALEYTSIELECLGGLFNTHGCAWVTITMRSTRLYAILVSFFKKRILAPINTKSQLLLLYAPERWYKAA